MRRGLVLGCGGSSAWRGRSRCWPSSSAWDWDARTAEVIVGTSAGAELACMLGGGTAVADLALAQRGSPDAPVWIADHLRADPGRFRRVPGRDSGLPAS